MFTKMSTQKQKNNKINLIIVYSILKVFFNSYIALMNNDFSSIDIFVFASYALIILSVGLWVSKK